jgi:anti-sigma-K factor RskA
MVNEDRIIELLPAYALGALDAAEVEQVESHLPLCAACRAELREIEAVTNDLPLALVEVNPPASIRQKLMARIEDAAHNEAAAQPPSAWQQIAAVFQQNRAIAFSQLALLALALILLASTLILRSQLGSRDSGPEPGRLQAIQLQSTGVIPNADGYVTVSHDGLSGAVILDQLPQLGEDQRYQLWLVNEAGERTSAALLSVDELGYGGGRLDAPQSLFSFAAAEITIETAEGSPQPTTDVILRAPLFP